MMKLLVRRVLVACCLATLTGCVEYRFRHLDGRDYYVGYPHTIGRLDPKISSKGKVYLAPRGIANPYVGGKFSKRRLTMDLGVLYYPSLSHSIELGYRMEVWQTNNQRFGDNTGDVRWDDGSQDIAYFGGRINF